MSKSDRLDQALRCVVTEAMGMDVRHICMTAEYGQEVANPAVTETETATSSPGLNKYREVPLNNTAREALTNYLPTLPPGATYVFPSRKHSPDVVGPIGERALIYIIGKYAEWARVADVSPHDLRHRFGYQMARVVPLHRLAQIMGHDSLDTTLRYVRGTQQDLQQAVETIAWA